MKDKFILEMRTPIKTIKVMPDVLRKFDSTTNDLYSRILKIRQPTEHLFKRIIEKSAIQKARKLRSTKELNLEIYGRLAVVLTLVFNFLFRIINHIRRDIYKKRQIALKAF